MRLDRLYAHASDLGLMVEHADLGSRFGEYHDGLDLIVLNRRLTRAQATSTLAHELAHALQHDRCSTPAVERRADETGAALAITTGEYASAERLVGEHPGALAVELGVTPRLVFAWRRWYARRPVHSVHKSRKIDR